MYESSFFGFCKANKCRNRLNQSGCFPFFLKACQSRSDRTGTDALRGSGPQRIVFAGGYIYITKQRIVFAGGYIYITKQRIVFAGGYIYITVQRIGGAFQATRNILHFLIVNILFKSDSPDTFRCARCTLSSASDRCCGKRNRREFRSETYRTPNQTDFRSLLLPWSCREESFPAG